MNGIVIIKKTVVAGLTLVCIVFILSPHSCAHGSWADITLERMSLEEKIGQLCVVAAVSNDMINKEFMVREPYHMDPEYIKQLVTDYHVGGVIFLGAGRIEEQCALTRSFQSMSSIPLIIAQDFEWGLSMRLVDAVRFPRALVLGALQDQSLIYAVGYEIGRQARQLGVHLVLAPVADVNSNPNNPIIGTRSFGDDPHVVAERSLLFARGLQDAGVLSCAKHFPGHGDTSVDSHVGLPRVLHAKDRLENIELVPFAHLINNGIAAVMTAHLAIPVFTGGVYTPATVSPAVVTDLLRTQLGFEGLIITDGLGMRGITDQYVPGELEVAALLAGNDILLCPVDVPCAIACIKQAVEDGRIAVKLLDEHVMRILRAKEQLLACCPESFMPTYDHTVFHGPAVYELQRQVYHSAGIPLPVS